MLNTPHSDWSLVVASAVNDEAVLCNNLGASPLIAEGGVPLVAQRGYVSAGEAYNRALDKANADVVVLAHQDVYLPRGWEKRLLLAIETLENERRKWAVLGVIGVDSDGMIVGDAWSNALHSRVGRRVFSPTRVQSLDEIVIVLKRRREIRFDAGLPGFHLYGTDIVQSALSAGFESYVFDGPVIHNSVPACLFNRHYLAAYWYVRAKWWSVLPIHTTVVPVTRSPLPMLACQLHYAKASLRRKQRIARKARRRLGDPLSLAISLGYDSTSAQRPGELEGHGVVA
jgi:hypothetical protein